MTPAELKPIVNAWGGVEKFAPIVGVKPRLVYYWLAGERKMREATSEMIRTLEPPKGQKEGV